MKTPTNTNEAIERQFNAKHSRRLAAEDRYLARLERLEAKAAPMVGELVSGRFYAFPVGGRYFESASHTAVVDYLIRNKWVR
jgi:hypothetical protein